MNNTPVWLFQNYLSLAVVGLNLLHEEDAAAREISRDIFNALPVPVVIHNCTGECIFGNDVFFKLGISCEDALGSIKFSSQALSNVLDRGIPVLNFKDEINLSAGNHLSVQLNIFPLFDSWGKRAGSITFIRDLKEEMEHDLFQRITEFVLDAVQAGVIALDAAGRVVIFNRYCGEILGFPPDSVQGRTWADLLKELEEDKRNALTSLFAEGKVHNNELVLTTGGIERRFGVKSLDFEVEHFRRQNKVVVLNDLTKTRVLEKQLQDSEKLMVVGELAAGTAHEIRNPLTTIRGFVQILQQKARDSGFDDITRYADIIINEIDHVNAIIAEFLMLAKPSIPRRTDLNVNLMVKQIFQFVENEALRMGIELKDELAENLPPVLGDQEQLKQVLLNIVNNAFQAMTGGKGTLLMRTCHRLDEGKVLIEIEDSGMGISSENLDKLFNPFFSTKEEGTGLGLAISKRIVEAHGGEITVKSEEGAGSRFTVCLPAATGA